MYKLICCLFLFLNSTICLGEGLKFELPSRDNWQESSEVKLLGLTSFSFKKNSEIKMLISIIRANMKKAKFYDDRQLIKEVSQGKVLTDRLLNHKDVEILEKEIIREKDRIIILKKESYKKDFKHYTRILKTYIYEEYYFSSELVWPDNISDKIVKEAKNNFLQLKIYE